VDLEKLQFQDFPGFEEGRDYFAFPQALPVYVLKKLVLHYLFCALEPVLGILLKQSLDQTFQAGDNVERTKVRLGFFSKNE